MRSLTANAAESSTTMSAALYQLGALSQRLNANQVERAQADARALLESRSKASAAGQVDARSAYRR